MKTLFVVVAALLTSQCLARSLETDQLRQVLEKLLNEKKGSQKGSQGNDRDDPNDASGPANEPETPPGDSLDDIDWIQLIKDECNVDLHDFEQYGQKVEPDEVLEAVNDLSVFLNGAATTLDVHNDNIIELETLLGDDATTTEVVQGHTGLYEDFMNTLDTVGAKALCPATKLGVIVARLDIAGGHKFKRDEDCGNSGGQVADLLKEVDGDYGAALALIDSDFIHRFGGNIRKDMACIIADIASFRDLTSFMSAADRSKLTLRDATIGLSMVDAYGTVVGREITEFKYAVDVVGYALEFLPHLTVKKEASFTKSSTKTLDNILTDLKSFLANMKTRK